MGGGSCDGSGEVGGGRMTGSAVWVVWREVDLKA